MTDVFGEALVLATANQGEMALWTEDKKKEYVDLFKVRAADSRFIMQATALIILERTENRKFIGVSQSQKLRKKYWGSEYFTSDRLHWSDSARDSQAMFEIARDRATKLVKQLPSMKKVLTILDPATAKDMEDIGPLQEDYEEVVATMRATPSSVSLDDWPETATRLEIQNDIRAHEENRKALLEKQHKLSKQINTLQMRIDRTLIKGIPGIRDEIESAVVQLVEQSHGIDALSRRIEEQVLYGQSELAMDLLRHFQKDEAHVSEDITIKFNAGLEKLKLIQAKKTKTKAKTKAKT